MPRLVPSNDVFFFFSIAGTLRVHSVFFSSSFAAVEFGV